MKKERGEEDRVRCKKKTLRTYEPLLFQFNELAENALRRLIALTRESREGKLEENE